MDLMALRSLHTGAILRPHIILLDTTPTLALVLPPPPFQLITITTTLKVHTIPMLTFHLKVEQIINPNLILHLLADHHNKRTEERITIILSPSRMFLLLDLLCRIIIMRQRIGIMCRRQTLRVGMVCRGLVTLIVERQSCHKSY